VWQDEFEGGTLDSSKWTTQSGIRRDATNTPAAVVVADSVLTTTYTNEKTHYTGFIDTAGKYEPTYGYFEARMRFEPTAGEWGVPRSLREP
jgi:beta-glucanase (GH16 family)